MTPLTFALMVVAGALVTGCSLFPVANEGQPSGNVQELTVTATDLRFDPTSLRVVAGQPVRLTLVNKGAVEHDWQAVGLKATKVQGVSIPDRLSAGMRSAVNARIAEGTPYAAAGAGQQMVVAFTPSETGSFQLICTVPGHKEAGMTGQIAVVDAAGSSPAQGSSDGRSAGSAQAPGGAQAPRQAVQQPPSDSRPSGGGNLPLYAESGSASSQPVVAPRLRLPATAAALTGQTPRHHQVEIETVEVLGQLDDGVAYNYWTFGGTVPGPMLRVREGDTVELTLKNALTSKVTHSIDLHAVTGPGGGAKLTQVAPGDQAAFHFQALNPGVYVYHCATPPVAQHVANGMYGLIVVEPAEGLRPVDREFYVMQGELYPAGARGEKGERAFSMDKMLDERPDYVVFNGSLGALTGDGALQARVGETVRIYFGVGGPNVTSSFHVIGEIFDRVAQEGGSAWTSNVQTTMVPAGGATIVEFKLEVPGDYVLVDHSLGRVAKGSAGILHVEGPENPAIYQSLTPDRAVSSTAH